MPPLQSRVIVGMEVHVQVRTASKLFCACPVAYDAPPNSAVCPVCLGHPGTLPVINRRAVERAALVGMALNCRIAAFTKWDRKSYFYPDLPKNYQISQYDLPLASEGWFDVPGEANDEGRTLNADSRMPNAECRVSNAEPLANESSPFSGKSASEQGGPPPGWQRVRIRRAHLEEDAGKNLHDQPGCSLIDLNRAGTPLIEIVTEPDLRSAEACYAFAVELQRLMRHLGVSDGIMQKGQMRFEPNVNVAIEVDGREVRTPIVEIKNLNSFKAIRGAVAFEAQRQTAEWQADSGYVLGQRPNENRGWNDAKGVTEYQRPKEAAHDYRYFPDPDLTPVKFDEPELQAIRAGLCELPTARARRLRVDLAVSSADAQTLVDDRATADLFEASINCGAPPDVLSKQFVNIWAALANERSMTVAGLALQPARLAELARLVKEGTISASAAALIAPRMLDTPDAPGSLADAMGLLKVKDAAATQAWVDEALRLNEQAVRDAVANPKKARQAAGFLRGQVMKLSGGRADPRLVGELIERGLAPPPKSD
ncbi:MAG: Asp-tRNA(Asn)/Glu-tRNA(Gln) amidotransferase subunit GatB [Phycisphaerales bacterium]|nr:Asp-tRNA(Asn)/Glu-tRNA(Gln) amidotransferase subunit GatB [Phycisphaerales bacterium]